MRAISKYIFTAALFLQIALAANVPVAASVQSFSGFNSFGSNFEADGGHKLARSASGKLHAVFVNFSGSGSSKNYKLIRAYSAGLGFTTNVITENSGTSAFLHNPALAVSGEDVYMVYVDSKSGTDRRLSILKYTADGSNLQSTAITINNSLPWYYLDIALDKDDYIYVAATYAIEQKVRIFRSNSPGNISSFTEEKCSGADFNTTRAYLPKLAVDESGNVYLAYELRSTDAADSPKRIAVHKRGKIVTSTFWASAVEVSPNFRAQHPDIVFHDGRLHMVYSEQPNSINDNSNLRYRIYNADLTNVLSDDIVLSAKKIYSPRLSFSGNTPLIQYVDSADGSAHLVKMTARDASGSWLAPQTLADAPNAVYAHSVADIANDLPDVLWYNTTDQKVYFAAKTETPDLVAPLNGGVTINGGETLTKNPVLQLTLSASDAGSGLASVNISETPALSAVWRTYAASVEYTLSDQTRNQAKTLYVWYRDKAGNISEVSTRSIYLTDAGGSGGKVKINNDAPYTNTRNVTLTFNNNHAWAYDMRVSDDSTVKWVSKNTTLAWDLSSGDGTKTVSVEYRNMAGNVTWSGTSDTIYLDTATPDITSATSSLVSSKNSPVFTWTAADNPKNNYASGVSTYNIYWGGNSSGAAPTAAKVSPNSNYAPSSLSTQGTYYLRVQPVDRAGNTGNWVTAAEYVYDNTAPEQAAVTINNGAVYTATSNVKLAFKAADSVSGVVSMNISNTSAKNSWLNYTAASNYSWLLTGADGLKTVYVWFRDKAGNETLVTDNIYLDTTKPAGTLTINGGETLTKNSTLYLTLSASTDTVSMNISEINSLSANWLAFSSTHTYKLIDTATGNHTIYIWYRDAAGNTSNVISDSIMLSDQGGSGGAVKINNDAPYTNTRNVTLTFSGNHALAYDMRVSDDSTAKWVSKNTTLAWDLSSGDGTKTVYVEYRNMAGNVTWSGTSDTIYLDTALPSGSVASVAGGVEYGGNTYVDLVNGGVSLNLV
ncbi:phage tail protein, partial [Candidatus Termititenax aidoneus]